MQKKPPPKHPTRENILAFITREREAGRGDKIGKREIARAFGLAGSDKINLKAILRDLEKTGDVERRRKGLVVPGTLPSVVLADVVRLDADGELIATPAEWDEARFGPLPRILLHRPRRPKAGDVAPGVGDRVLARTDPLHDADDNGPRYTGRVIKVLSKAKTRTLGIFRIGARGARIEPVEKKQVGREYVVAQADRGDAQDGDLVAVELLGGSRFGATQARVREVVGSLASEKAVSLIALHVHGIPDAFRADTLAEAKAARPTTLQAEGFAREDWREVPLVTIDPPDAKDHDDAVFAERDSDPANEDGFIVTVAIADVSFYVRPESALDREALVRGNSVYFPDRVVPMLPEEISNDLCSLVPMQDRPALAVRLFIAKDGRKKQHSFHRVMMRSHAKLSYAQAQAAFDGQPDETTAPLRDNVLTPLLAAYECAKQAREQRAPLDLDLPERKILLKDDGTVDRVVVPPRLEAHRLIEEFMILANVAAAETLEDRRQRLVYRAHDEPSAEKLTALSEFLSTIGIKLAKGQTMRAAIFNTILSRVKDTENEKLVNEVVLRAQAQAEYTAENYGHFGLNLRRYAHFTSPIRRYADLIVHRALVRALGLGPGGMVDNAGDDLAEIAVRISAAERRAMAAERETNDRLIAGYLADRIGATFSGRISGVTRAGLFVKLVETGADGFVPMSTLGNERFHFEEGANAIVGARSGEGWRLGDVVEVKLVEAAPLAGALRFAIESDGRAIRSSGKTKRSGRSAFRGGPQRRGQSR